MVIGLSEGLEKRRYRSILGCYGGINTPLIWLPLINKTSAFVLSYKASEGDCYK